MIIGGADCRMKKRTRTRNSSFLLSDEPEKYAGIPVDIYPDLKSLSKACLAFLKTRKR